ncbi:unnamed protein product [Moneuplotes crassus]|uniref:Uncharacterized protein n=1 Tax=Euplotes crassus TaxID=5936 RepID=A0AAD1U7E1_EUPCR|nr:unnamed protein product [Moneuplotes crassus]
MEDKTHLRDPNEASINPKLHNTDEKYSSPVVDRHDDLDNGPRRFVGSNHKAGWMNARTDQKDDFNRLNGGLFGDNKINLQKFNKYTDNKRKANYQNFYKKMLDKQIELKRNREMETRVKEMREDVFAASLGKSSTNKFNIDPKFQNFRNPMEYDSVGAYNNKTIDCLPHEWNEPGMRYLRKSMSTTNNGSNFRKDSHSRGLVNKSVDHSLTRYNAPPSMRYKKHSYNQGDGKRSMLEPLMNIDTRRNIRKQMTQNYKYELDKQVAKKQAKPQDIYCKYSFDEGMAVTDERSQAYPVNQNGSIVRDSDYDRQITKFIERDMAIDNNYKKEIYDEDAFKRRDLRAKIKNLTSTYSNQQRMNSAMKYSNSHRDYYDSPMKTPQVHQRKSSHKQGDLKLREKIYSKRASKESNKTRADSQNMRSNVGSRDERLKVPKSLSDKKAISKPKNDAPQNNKSVEHINKAITNQINESAPEPPGSFIETEGSRRKRLLQVSNQVNSGNPFAKLKMPTNEAYMAKHLGMFRPF